MKPNLGTLPTGHHIHILPQAQYVSQGIDLSARPQRMDVLRLAGSRITDKTVQRFADDFDAKGIGAVPKVLDILNCTELTDGGATSTPKPCFAATEVHSEFGAVAGLQRLCEIDLQQFQQSRVEQRTADFALTGLRIQEAKPCCPPYLPTDILIHLLSHALYVCLVPLQAEIQIFVGEKPKKHLLRNGVRRSTFGVNDGLYLYKSSNRFRGKDANQQVTEDDSDAVILDSRWCVSRNPNEAIAKVVAVEQPYKEYDEKTDSKKIKRGGVLIEGTSEGEVTIELRCAPGENAVYNCTTHEAINVRVLCKPVATASKD